MFLVVGLGNPGKKYENTYHNVGFCVLDAYSKNKTVNITKKKGNALIFEGKINNQKVILAKPQTYMNLSGSSVSSLAKKFKIEPNNIVIVYDDVDLDVGQVRFRSSGSGGTHNGMRDIVKALGTQVKRVRIGVGRGSGKSLADFVLSQIKKQEKPIIEEAVVKAIELIDEIINNNGEMENKSM